MRRALLFGFAVVGLLSSGCYYSHLASGQLKLLWAQQPIDRALENPEISEESRALLSLVGAVREFAADLGLEVGGQYTSFVDWPDDRIVTTLVRTRPPSIEAVPYWFPIVGSLPYKGYFDRTRAESEAERLRETQDFDVCVSGVSAYSTLGWLNDPVTSPMLKRGSAELVETLFHELVHATVFVDDDVDFNESVAQFIGQQAAIAFFARGPIESASDRTGPSAAPNRPRALWPDVERVRQSIEDRREIAQVTTRFRATILALADAPNRIDARAVAEIEARMELAALPLRTIDPVEVAVRARLNDACLALRGTYTLDLPRHAEVFAALDGNLEAMIRRLRQVGNEELTTAEFYDVEPRSSGIPTTADLDISSIGARSNRHGSEGPDRIDGAR